MKSLTTSYESWIFPSLSAHRSRAPRWPTASIFRRIAAIWRAPAAIVSCAPRCTCAGRAESQIPLRHQSDFRSRTWRMVGQHRQSLGDRTISDADHKLEVRSRQSQPFVRGRLQRPDCVGNGSVANAATGSMFNIAAFNPSPQGPVGNWGGGILQRPGTATIAAGLSKTSYLTEKMRMGLESTFTKLFNHPNFRATVNERNVFVLWHRSECSERGEQRKSRRPGFATARLLDCGSEPVSELLVLSRTPPPRCAVTGRKRPG